MNDFEEIECLAGFGASGEVNGPTTKLRFEAVDTDSQGNKLAGKTIRLRIDDGPWFYGAESMAGDLNSLMERNGVKVP